MTITELRAKVNDLRTSMTPDMSMTAVSACQARIDLLSKAIAAYDRLAEAQATADRAVEECVKWG